MSGMKKGVAVLIALVVVGVGVGLYGARQGWFKRADNTSVPVPAKLETIPELVNRLDRALNSGDMKQESAAHTEISKPENYGRLLAAIEDETQPLDLRKGSLLLAARSRADLGKLLPLLTKHAGNPGSPLRGEALTALSGLPNLDRIDTRGYIAVTLVTAAKDADGGLRLAATHGLAKLSNKAAVQALVERLSDPDVLVRKVAAGRLKALAGDNFGYSYSRPPEGQTGAVEKYRAWAASYAPKS